MPVHVIHILDNSWIYFTITEDTLKRIVTNFGAVKHIINKLRKSEK